MTVGPDCVVTVGAPRALTSFERMSFASSASALATRSCRYVNRMIGAGGEWDILTELNTRQDFDYDGIYVTYDSPSSWTYNHHPSGWYVSNSWQWVRSSTPTPAFRVDSWAQFNYYGFDHHAKTNETYGYGDGNCAANFYHTGDVCRGCATRFYVLYQ